MFSMACAFPSFAAVSGTLPLTPSRAPPEETFEFDQDVNQDVEFEFDQSVEYTDDTWA